MNIIRMVLGDYQTNCYIVSDDNKNAVIIDPGYTPEVVLERIRQEQLKVQAVLLTHCHFDHVGGVKGIAEATRCPVWINEKDLQLPTIMTNGTLYYTDCYEEGEVLNFGELTFEVWETPGHTPGSVCLKAGEDLFTGDTLFSGSCGRTDLPKGSTQDMFASLHRLASIDENLKIHPGHGQESTFALEHWRNPYFH